MRGDRAEEEPGEGKVEEEPAKKRRSSASWARLIAKVFHADPLTCRKCGGKLKIVAYLHKSAVTPRTAAPGGAEVKTLGRSLSPLLACWRRSGPWGATIVKTVDCSDVTTCSMAMHCLGCPPFLWYGEKCESENRPAEVIFIPELTPRPINSSRCPGSLSQCGNEVPSPAPAAGTAVTRPDLQGLATPRRPEAWT